MSAAAEFAPVFDLPSCARSGGQRRATVTALRRPSAGSVASPLRLTRLGVLVLALAVAGLSVALVLTAWLSAPHAPAGRSSQPAAVVVHDGDTLWSIAARIAPGRDPRAAVADLKRRNHLEGVELTPGQVLRTH